MISFIESGKYVVEKRGMPYSWRTEQTGSSASKSLAFALIVVTLTCVALVTGCQTAAKYPTSKVSFEGLCGLTRDQFAQMDQAHAHQWLADQYGALPSSGISDGLSTLSVGTQDKGGATVFFFQQRILAVVRTLKNGPTFGELVAALDAPQMIYARGEIREHVILTLGMDYPKLGISVFMNKRANPQEIGHQGRLEIQLKQDLVTDLVECYEPHASMQEFLSDRFSFYPQTLQFELNRRKPWSGFDTWIPLEP